MNDKVVIAGIAFACLISQGLIFLRYYIPVTIRWWRRRKR